MVTRDVFKVLKLHSPAARENFENFKNITRAIYHEMHSRPYDFLYLLSIVNRIDVSQECPPGSASFRDAQCSLFNRRDIFINGQKARWISYMRGNKTM